MSTVVKMRAQVGECVPQSGVWRVVTVWEEVDVMGEWLRGMWRAASVV